MVNTKSVDVLNNDVVLHGGISPLDFSLDQSVVRLGPTVVSLTFNTVDLAPVARPSRSPCCLHSLFLDGVPASSDQPAVLANSDGSIVYSNLVSNLGVCPGQVVDRHVPDVQVCRFPFCQPAQASVPVSRGYNSDSDSDHLDHKHA